MIFRPATRTQTDFDRAAHRATDAARRNTAKRGAWTLRIIPRDNYPGPPDRPIIPLIFFGGAVIWGIICAWLTLS